MLCLNTTSDWSQLKMKVLLISVYFARLVLTKRPPADGDDLSSYRLPNAISPVNYQLTLLPVIEDKPRLCGHVWINVTVETPTNVIILHGNILPVETVVYADSEPTDDNEVSRSMVEKLCFSGVLATLEQLSDDERKTREDKDFAQSVHLKEDIEQMIIILKEELMVGAHYRIGILYLAEINDGDNIGFFRVQKKNEDINNCCPQRYCVVWNATYIFLIEIGIPETLPLSRNIVPFLFFYYLCTGLSLYAHQMARSHSIRTCAW